MPFPPCSSTSVNFVAWCLLLFGNGIGIWGGETNNPALHISSGLLFETWFLLLVAYLVHPNRENPTTTRSVSLSLIGLVMLISCVNLIVFLARDTTTGPSLVLSQFTSYELASGTILFMCISAYYAFHLRQHLNIIACVVILFQFLVNISWLFNSLRWRRIASWGNLGINLCAIASVHFLCQVTNNGVTLKLHVESTISQSIAQRDDKSQSRTRSRISSRIHPNGRLSVPDHRSNSPQQPSLFDQPSASIETDTSTPSTVGQPVSSSVLARLADDTPVFPGTASLNTTTTTATKPLVAPAKKKPRVSFEQLDLPTVELPSSKPLRQPKAKSEELSRRFDATTPLVVAIDNTKGYNQFSQIAKQNFWLDSLAFFTDFIVFRKAIFKLREPTMVSKESSGTPTENDDSKDEREKLTDAQLEMFELSDAIHPCHYALLIYDNSLSDESPFQINIPFDQNEKIKEYFTPQQRKVMEEEPDSVDLNVLLRLFTPLFNEICILLKQNTKSEFKKTDYFQKRYIPRASSTPSMLAKEEQGRLSDLEGGRISDISFNTESDVHISRPEPNVIVKNYFPKRATTEPTLTAGQHSLSRALVEQLRRTPSPSLTSTRPDFADLQSFTLDVRAASPGPPPASTSLHKAISVTVGSYGRRDSISRSEYADLAALTIEKRKSGYRSVFDQLMPPGSPNHARLSNNLSNLSGFQQPHLQYQSSLTRRTMTYTRTSLDFEELQLTDHGSNNTNATSENTFYVSMSPVASPLVSGVPSREMSRRSMGRRLSSRLVSIPDVVEENEDEPHEFFGLHNSDSNQIRLDEDIEMALDEILNLESEKDRL